MLDDGFLHKDQALRDCVARMLQGTPLNLEDLYEDMKRANPGFEQEVLPSFFTTDPPVQGADLKPALKSVVSHALEVNGESDTLRIEALRVNAQCHPIMWRTIRDGMRQTYLNEWSEEKVWESLLKDTAAEFRDLVWESETPPLPIRFSSVKARLHANNLPRPTFLLTQWLTGQPVTKEHLQISQSMLADPTIQQTVAWCMQEGKDGMYFRRANLKPALRRMYELALNQNGLPRGDELREIGEKPELLRACAIRSESEFKVVYFKELLEKAKSEALKASELPEREVEVQAIVEREPSVGEAIVGALVEGAVEKFFDWAEKKLEPETVVDAEAKVRKLRREREEVAAAIERAEVEARTRWFGKARYEEQAAYFRAKLSKLDDRIIDSEARIEKLRQRDSRAVHEGLGIPPEVAGVSGDELSDVKDKQDTLEDIFGSGRAARRSDHERQYWKNKAKTAQYRKQAQAFEQPSKPELSPGEKKKANKNRVLKELEALIREKDEQVRKASDEETARRMANIYDDKIRDKTEEMRKCL